MDLLYLCRVKRKNTIETIAKVLIDVGKLVLAAFVLGGFLLDEINTLRIIIGFVISIVLIGGGVLLVSFNEKEEEK